ncbi:MAG: hypothetical protein V7724_00305 [Sediminicola sp.]
MKTPLLFLFLFCTILGHSQSDINNYKYIIVPKKFADFKNENQYQTSTLVKYLFVQNGFNAVYDDALPQELNANRCLGLNVSLRDASNLFTTKTLLVLKNCQNQEIFVTQEGISKEKEYKSAYTETIKEAFASIEGLNYTYSPSENAPTANVATNVDTPAASIKEEVRGGGAAAVHETKTDLPSQTAGDVEEATPSLSGTLYAQELANGYQLVDSTPKIVVQMTKTALPDVYIAQSGGRDGMVYKKEGKWYFEYSQEGNTLTEELNIKF